MNILEKIKKRLGITSPEKLAEGIATSFNEKKQSGEENPIDRTVEEIMNIIKQNQDPDVTRKLLTKILEKDEIPNRVAVKTFTKISESEEIPDKIITQVVDNTQVPDEVINTIIEEGRVNPNERLKLIQNVENREIKENRVKYELKVLYNDCKDKRDGEVADRINEIKDILQEDEISKEIQDLIHQVVAKKMAENCHSEYKGTKVYELSKAISTEEMIECDLPSIVLDEYRRIESEEGARKDTGFFSESNLETNLRRQILNQMAGEVVRLYRETSILSIPQSENMRKITPDEEKMFIKTIINLSEELSEEEIIDIKAQIRGKVTNTKAKESIIINKIKKMADKNKNIDLLIKLFEEEETLRTLAILEETDLITELNSVPEEKRRKTVESIGEVLEKRKVATQTVNFGENNKQRIDLYIDSEYKEGR